jgi:hypothetical protein
VRERNHMPDRHRAAADPPEDPPELIVATLSRLTRDTRFLLTLLDGSGSRLRRLAAVTPRSDG